MTGTHKLLERASDTFFAGWAFVDVAVVVAVPIAVVALAWRGRPFWKSYALVVLPYFGYAALAGHMPYLTAYVVIIGCLVPDWYLRVHLFHCRSSWENWAVATVVLGVVPTIVLGGISAVRRRVRPRS